MEKPVAVVIGATSKWQSDGRMTQLAHGSSLDDSDLPVGVHEDRPGSGPQPLHRKDAVRTDQAGARIGAFRFGRAIEKKSSRRSGSLPGGNAGALGSVPDRDYDCELEPGHGGRVAAALPDLTPG